MKKLNIHHKKIKKLSPSKNAFASLARSIIYQQISGKAAASIEKKFLTLFQGKKFPKPEEILKLSDAQFQGVGVSLQKRTYLRDLSLKFLDKTIVPKKFPKMTDEEIREHLTAVKGIGKWTADMFLIFALNRPNVLPLGDLAIVKGFRKAFELRAMPSESKMMKLAMQYHGKHTQLSLYLWHIIDEGTESTW